MAGATTRSATPRIGRGLWFVLVPLLGVMLAVTLLIESTTIVGRDAIYPRLALCALLLVAIVTLARESIASRNEPAGSTEVEGGRGQGVAWRPVSITAAALALVPASLVVLGYIATTALVCMTCIIAIGRRSWLAAIVTTVAVSAGAYVLFVVVLGARIPNGWLLP